MMPKHVAIVAEGSWAGMRNQDYDAWTESMVVKLRAVRRRNYRTGTDTEEPRATVEVVTLAELREKLKRIPGRPDVVIFRTRDMAREAHAIKREYPHARVIVFSGLLPEDEVIFVDKGWDLSAEATTSIVLD